MPRLSSHDLETISRLSRAASDLLIANAQLATANGALATDYVEASARRMCSYVDALMGAAEGKSDSDGGAASPAPADTHVIKFTADQLRAMDMAILELPSALMAALRKAEMKTVGDIENRIKLEAQVLAAQPGIGFANFKRVDKAIERLLRPIPF